MSISPKSFTSTDCSGNVFKLEPNGANPYSAPADTTGAGDWEFIIVDEVG